MSEALSRGRCTALLLALSASMNLVCAAQTDQPQDYALRIPVTAEADAHLLRLTLPVAAYRALRSPALADLRVFNAAGEALPLALLPETEQRRAVQRDVPLLTLPGIPDDTGKDAGVAIERDPAGRILRLDLQEGGSAQAARMWIADLLDFRTPLQAITLRVDAQGDFSGAVRVDVSDDLAQWRTVVAAAPLLYLQQGDQHIEQLRIALPQLRTRYLRLVWRTPPAGVLPAGLQLEGEEVTPLSATQWTNLEGVAGKDANSFDYDSPALLPVRQIRVQFAEPNTVAELRAYSRPDSHQPWRFVVRGAVHTLRENNITTDESTALDVAPQRLPQWQLRFDSRTGPRQAPHLELGWRPEEIVFPARGAGPYMLAVGRDGAASMMSDIRQVVPGYGRPDAPALQTASANVAAAIGRAEPPGRDLPTWRNPRILGLWGVLLLAVVVLARMAYSLLRKPPTP